MVKCKFLMPDGKVALVESDSFVTALMEVANVAGIKAISCLDVPDPLPKTVTSLSAKRKAKHESNVPQVV